MPKKADDPTIPNLTPTDDTTSADTTLTQDPPVTPVVESTDNAAQLRAEFAELNRQALSEAAAENSRLRQELAAAQNSTTAAPKPESFSDFMEAPRTAMREELKAVVAPLLEFQQEYTRERQYAKLVAGLDATPNIKKLYIEVAPYVDKMMSQQEATPQNLQASVISAYGAYKAGLLGDVAPAPTPTPKPTADTKVTDTTPPHIPPSPPPAPRKSAAAPDGLDAKVEALTETERKVARAQGFTDLRLYVQYRDADPDVGTWGGIK